MGGPGGAFLPEKMDPEKLKRLVRQTMDALTDDQFKTRVAKLLSEELASYNNRDVEGIRSILDKVKEDLKDELEGTVDLLLGGSVAKHTYVDGLSDIDALVLLSRSDVARKIPDELKSTFAEALRARFGRDNVEEGTLAVTLTVDDKTIQLLPAVREMSGFKIATSDGKNWSRINPQAFAGALTKRNLEMNSKLVPTIKLTKSIIASLPESCQVTGYHTESLAIEAFKGYAGPRTTGEMLRHFFEKAPALVKTPIKDSTGQSVHVDEYLGERDSKRRCAVADALAIINRRMKNADTSGDLERWRELLGSF